MLILTLRTDNPVAEIGIYKDARRIDYLEWDADRKLAESIHKMLEALLVKNELSLQNIEAIIVYEGPGSFTGLRIGLSVANAFAYGLGVPIVSATSDNWIKLGEQKLQSGQNEVIAMPEYGALPNITQPRK